MALVSTNRYLAAAAAVLMAAASVTGGCHFPFSPETYYLPEREDGDEDPGEGERHARNDLKVGIRKLKVLSAEGEEVDPEAGNPRLLGQVLSEKIREAALFAEVYYPYIDEDVDVVLEPTVTVGFTKNRGTNALKVMPGIILVWFNGMGFDYDHSSSLVVQVRNARQQGAVCGEVSGDAAMIAERYPSVLWFLGLHVGLIILTILETASTDSAVVTQLVEQSFARATEPVIEQLVAEFMPTAKPCGAHPDEKQSGRFCKIGGRDLYYPMPFEGQAKPPEPED